MNININSGVTAPIGFLASGIYCGLKKNPNKKDLALIFSEKIASAAGVYTKNKVKGAPLTVSKEHLINKKAQGIIINSGNANTCNGDDGLSKAEKTCVLCGTALDIAPNDILVASTGVIGVPLNLSAIESGIPSLVSALNKDGGLDSAEAIMTTDTVLKQGSITFKVGEKNITLGAMAKGSGMIHPNMATMLSFITTDLNISEELLEKALKDSVDISYNRISVDGDMSTNDMVLILANGMANNPKIIEEDSDYDNFCTALKTLNIYLSRRIAKDGEGATKLMECIVKNCSSINEGEILAKSVINSSLVKTAIFGSDANWGRILCALGYTDVDFDPEKVDVSFKSSVGEINICTNGSNVNFDEPLAKEILLKDEIQIIIDMKSGNNDVTCWGCDLTYDYVKINGDYRS